MTPVASPHGTGRRSLTGWLARQGSDPRRERLFRLAFGGAFSRREGTKVLVLYESNRIAFSQVYPFLMYARAFAAHHDAQFRLLPTDAALKGLPRAHLEATHVIAQVWGIDHPERLEAVRARLQELPAGVQRIYLDGFANADIRFARRLPEFRLYYKKSLLSPRTELLRPRYGHTNLTEHYARLYGIAQEPTDWQVPPDMLPRLRLAPNFLTAPDLVGSFLGAPPPQDARRDIDVNARIGGTRMDSWYGAMRRDAEARATALQGLRVTTGSGLTRERFMAELGRSRICFSPFGYGEICWRDIEAFATGSVLLKPDMSHIDTEPDLYRDDETYVALKWDFSDFEEKVRTLLADDARRDRIARTAWQTARRYLEQNGPVTAYSDIFAA